MKRTKMGSLLVALFITITVYAGDIDGGAVLGSALGAGVGSAIGSSTGGKNGAIIGGGVGGALGAAVGSNQDSSHSSRQVITTQRNKGRHYHRDRHNRRYYYSNGKRHYDSHRQHNRN